MRSGSNLERVLESGTFAVTAEIAPPKSTSTEGLRKKVQALKGCAEAFNLTDNQTAIVRLSSMASSVACLQEGAEPVMQMTCRDRNRIALQSDLFGAWALGIKNVLALTGDLPSNGDIPQAKGVFDLDSVTLLLCLSGDHQTFGNQKEARYV